MSRIFTFYIFFFIDLYYRVILNNILLWEQMFTYCQMCQVPVLSYASSEVRVLVLGRDPRAARHSRRSRTFCNGRLNCDDPGYCSDMVLDYRTALAYNELYPGRVRSDATHL